MTPKISVIIPSYNRASVLPRALDSVLAQSFCGFEVIVVDDGSSDQTSEVLAGYQCRPNLKVFKTRNRGVSAARNLGIASSLGEWLAFLDSDDEWLPEKLQKQMNFVEDNPSCRLVHGEEIWIRNGRRVNPMKKHQKRGGDVFADAVRFCCISPSTVLIKRDLLQEVGLFREDFPVCEDFDLWLRISGLYPVGYIGDFLIKKFGGHEDQLSQKFRAMDYWRILSLSKILETPISPLKKEQAYNELLKKSEILLKGYRKHQNLEHYDVVFNLLKSHKG